LRVIAGALRGRTIRAPAGLETRPTGDRVREALYDLLGPAPGSARVLDLFAGSGALGIEALSRGAVFAQFVERARPALAALRANLADLGLEDVSRVVRGDALSEAALAGGPWGLVLVDPPWAAELDEAVVQAVAPVLAPGGILVLEHPARREAPQASEGLAVFKSRRYGDTGLTLYERREST
jgi:16S rRNA (guanine966-N2)-methyltransferase